jgi:putative transcriptional regulator
MPRRRREDAEGSGLAALRRSGAVTETLFLFECATGEVPRLRLIADRLGLTVQAVSHLYRGLARRGLVESRGGQYRPTVRGVEALQSTLSGLAEETSRRLERLQIVRSARALARQALRPGQTVSLAMVDGILVATPGGRGSSHGRARTSARAGEPIDVTDLEGIVAIEAGPVDVWVVPRGGGGSASARRRASLLLRGGRHGLLVAQGLDALHLARAVTDEPVTRFGIAPACAEASRLGVRTLAFVAEEELPRFLSAFAGPSAPAVTVSRLG